MHLKGNQNIHKMKRSASSYIILVIISVIFHCSFQLCAARPEEVKETSTNQTVDLYSQFYWIFFTVCAFIISLFNQIIINIIHIKIGTGHGY